MVSDLQVYNSDVLDYNDAPRIIWIAVREAAKLLWDENPKLHDIGSLVQSFEKYGFQELPKFDGKLPNVSGGTGAIKAGNGRIETLAQMEKNGNDLPRGIAKDKNTGAWVMPILAGVDAETIDIARAYAIDSNSLTISGGDFSLYDHFKMYDDEKLKKVLFMLAENSEASIVIDRDAIDVIMLDNVVNRNDNNSDDEEYKDIIIRVYDLDRYKDILNILRASIDKSWNVEIKAYE